MKDRGTEQPGGSKSLWGIGGKDRAWPTFCLKMELGVRLVGTFDNWPSSI